MSHFADDETLALIAKLQTIIQEQAAEIESLQTSLILVKNSVTWRGNKITDLQHKMKVLTDALEYHQQQTRPIGRTIEALAYVREK